MCILCLCVCTSTAASKGPRAGRNPIRRRPIGAMRGAAVRRAGWGGSGIPALGFRGVWAVRCRGQLGAVRRRAHRKLPATARRALALALRRCGCAARRDGRRIRCGEHDDAVLRCSLGGGKRERWRFARGVFAPSVRRQLVRAGAWRCAGGECPLRCLPPRASTRRARPVRDVRNALDCWGLRMEWVLHAMCDRADLQVPISVIRCERGIR